MNDPERTERLAQRLGADRAVGGDGDPLLGGLAPPRPDSTQTADALRDAASVVRYPWQLSPNDPTAAMCAELADRLEAHADALDAAIAAGEPCPTCAERMEQVKVVYAYTSFPHNGRTFVAWRFVTPEAEK